MFWIQTRKQERVRLLKINTNSVGVLENKPSKACLLLLRNPCIKDSVLLTVHIENYHLDECGFVNNSPHVHFLILLAALLKTWRCSSDQNIAQLQTEALMCLSEATEVYN